MASSIYVYKNLEEYKEFYKGKDTQLVHQIPIIDMYVEPEKMKLFIVTNQDDDRVKHNLELFRTIVHVRNEEFVPSIFTPELNPVVVQYGKVIFNGKRGYIDFFPRRFRKALYSQHVDRFIGGSTDEHTYLVGYEYRYYDFLQDRINLILGDVQESVLSRLCSALGNLFRSKYPLTNK